MFSFPTSESSRELIAIVPVLRSLTKMVAIPGRSKGCHNCRKRRIKCGRFFSLHMDCRSCSVDSRIPRAEDSLDEGKPTCQRCSKAGYTCAGYERPLEFRHASAASFVSSTKTVGNSGKSMPEQVNSTAITLRSRSISPPPELSLVAFREDIYSAFLVANIVWRTYGTPWLEMAAKGDLGQLSLDASRALSQTNFGSAHHHEEIKLDGMIQYSKVLKALAPQLSNPRRQGMEEMIVPIMMLLLHAVRYKPLINVSEKLRAS